MFNFLVPFLVSDLSFILPLGHYARIRPAPNLGLPAKLIVNELFVDVDEHAFDFAFFLASFFVFLPSLTCCALSNKTSRLTLVVISCASSPSISVSAWKLFLDSNVALWFASPSKS